MFLGYYHFKRDSVLKTTKAQQNEICCAFVGGARKGIISKVDQPLHYWTIFEMMSI
jgi:hypothetical protein